MEEKIIDLLRKTFAGYEITADSSSDNIPVWDSIHQLNIAFEIESEFGISLEPEEMGSLNSVNNIIKLLTTKK